MVFLQGRNFYPSLILVKANAVQYIFFPLSMKKKKKKEKETSILLSLKTTKEIS